MSSRTVCVTGGAGFIGSHVAEALLAAGHHVLIVDDLSSGRKENVPPGAEFHELDVRSPEAAALVRDGGVEVLVHHAAQMDVRRSVADPVHDASVNIVGTLNLLEGARRGALAQVIFASTGGAMYGEQERFPADEDHPARPLSPYGVAKLSVERYLYFYNQEYGIDATALRYANVYGPRQNPHGEAGVVAIFGKRLLQGEPITIYGNGEQTRDLVYVEDVAAANLIAAERPLAALQTLDSRAFNIGTGVETSVNRLAELIATAAGRSSDVRRAPARAGEILRSALAVTKAERELGWRPRVALPDGLARTMRWIAEG